MALRYGYSEDYPIPEKCESCCRRNGLTCTAYTSFLGDECNTSIYNIEEYKKELKQMYDYNLERNNRVFTGKLKKELHRVNKIIDKQIKMAMKEDQQRGSGGGSSEGNSNSNAKQMMKDNRIQETKMTRGENKEYLEELRKWEEENGKLEKHRPNFGITRSKKDSYLEEEEC